MTRATFALRATLVVVITLGISLALRREAIAYSGPFNYDEAELLAAGRRAAMQLWMPMATASANTYFPLWPTTVGALDVLGLPMTLRFTHVLSACAYAAIISMVWIATARRWGWLWPAIFIAPPAFWMLVLYPDFMAMSTELPSTLLLVLGAVIAFPPGRAVSAKRLALVAAVASLAPWFKPQTGPLAVALVVSACGFAYLSREGTWTREEWRRRLALLVAGGLGPTVLLLAVMAIGGTLDLLWDEPVGFLMAYLTHNVSGLGVGEKTAPLSVKVDDLWHFLWVNFFAFVWTIVGLRGVWVGGRGSPGRTAAYAAIWATPIVAAVGTLLVLSPIYDHYLNLLYAGTAIAAIAGSGLPGPIGAAPKTLADLPALRHRGTTLIYLTTVVLALAALFAVKEPLGMDEPLHQDDRTLSALCPAGESVFVWGWDPQLYVYYDWQPASRYVTLGLLYGKTQRQDHYRSRFVRELSDNPPVCVVNAVGPTWFAGPTVDGVESEIPQSRELLEQCYTKQTVVFQAGDPASVWVRKPDC